MGLCLTNDILGKNFLILHPPHLLHNKLRKNFRHIGAPIFSQKKGCSGWPPGLYHPHTVTRRLELQKKKFRCIRSSAKVATGEKSKPSARWENEAVHNPDGVLTHPVLLMKSIEHKIRIYQFQQIAKYGNPNLSFLFFFCSNTEGATIITLSIR